MIKQKSKFLVAGISIAMAAPAFAASTFTGGGGNDLWSNAGNWNPNRVPTIPDGQVTINGSNTAIVSSAAPDIGGVLNVTTDSELIINADFGHASNQTNQDVWLNGTITQNGGDVYFSDDTRPAGGTHNMNGGTFVNRDYYRWDQASLLDIRGGSFTISGLFNPNGKTGTLKVVGDAATSISFGTIGGFGSGTLDMVLKDGGITTIDVTNGATLPGMLAVTLDAGFVLPGIDTNYTLISAGSLSGGFTTVDLPNAVDWAVNTVGNDVVLSYTASSIPEPATMSLFALGGLALLRRRCRA